MDLSPTSPEANVFARNVGVCLVFDLFCTKAVLRLVC